MHEIISYCNESIEYKNCSHMTCSNVRLQQCYWDAGMSGTLGLCGYRLLLCDNKLLTGSVCIQLRSVDKCALISVNYKHGSACEYETWYMTYLTSIVILCITLCVIKIRWMLVRLVSWLNTVHNMLYKFITHFLYSIWCKMHSYWLLGYYNWLLGNASQKGSSHVGSTNSVALFTHILTLRF